ncbi:hypothetical protein ATO8_04871 [Roseivivax marinus]|uniref:Uncharacterized protein n=1 Tax=Roseivivax marinus TaxID=1379903 RepID=W4HP36_9RHOB|nr:hypothetical protein [Roseivivax marinus]ETW14198.1 hypothetical protein ATO8_04871 [Roseivivax marinus]
MTTGAVREVTIGENPQMTVRIEEDDGNLFIQFLASEPEKIDIDGAFFNLTDDAVIPNLMISPSVDQLTAGNVTGFSAEAGALNSLPNGAVVEGDYDVSVSFGTSPSSTEGDVDDGKFTFWLDGEAPLSVDDIDLSSLTAVVNSDDGRGLVLKTGDAPQEGTTVTAFTEDFSCLWSPDHSENIVRDDGWDSYWGKLVTSGCNDGVLQFDAVETDGPVGITFEARANDPSRFEAGGWHGDSLTLEVRLDDGSWQTLDTFTVDHDRGLFVGSETGQTFGAHPSQLEYSGGVLDDASGQAEFRFVSDISSWDERIYIDDVSVTATEALAEVSSAPAEDTVVQSEDFGHLWWAEQSDAVEGHSDWDVQWGKLNTDGNDDGELRFDEVQTDGNVRFAFDAKAPAAHRFEQDGHAADSLRVEVQVDGSDDWQTLDTFVVNDGGTALVGSETGQEIGRDFSNIAYEGGVLEGASTVQFRFVSDISAHDEDIWIDNVEVTVLGEDAGSDGDAGDGGSQYEILFDPIRQALEETEDDADDTGGEIEEPLLAG